MAVPALPQPVSPDLAAYLAERARTFSLASRFLPAAQRPAVTVLYAFCRVVDDLADEPPAGMTADEVRARLGAWRRYLQSEGRDAGPAEPTGLAEALGSVISAYAVPPAYLLALLDGVESDLGQVVVPDFPALRRYCMRVAGAVGLAMCSILGTSEPASLAAAAQMGIAMQLTNVLRDLGADLRRGRVYLPADELAARGYTPESLVALARTPGPPDAALRALLRFQSARARTYYDLGLSGVALLPPAARPAVLVASLGYRAILDRVASMDFDVLRRRAVVSRSGKARVVVSALLAARRFDRQVAGAAASPPSLGEVLSWLAS